MIKKRRPGVLLGAAAMALSACAVDRAPTLSHAQPYDGAFGQVELISEKDETALRQEFSSALNRALSDHSVEVESGSSLVADFAVSATSIETGLDPVSGESEATKPKAPENRRPRWYNRCAPDRVRGSLAIFDRASNALVAKSEGHFIACPGDRDQLNGLANLLVKSVMNQGALANRE